MVHQIGNVAAVPGPNGRIGNKPMWPIAVLAASDRTTQEVGSESMG